jgi:hypothetical protein
MKELMMMNRSIGYIGFLLISKYDAIWYCRVNKPKRTPIEGIILQPPVLSLARCVELGIFDLRWDSKRDGEHLASRPSARLDLKAGKKLRYFAFNNVENR